MICSQLNMFTILKYLELLLYKQKLICVDNLYSMDNKKIIPTKFLKEKLFFENFIKRDQKFEITRVHL